MIYTLSLPNANQDSFVFEWDWYSQYCVPNVHGMQWTGGIAAQTMGHSLKMPSVCIVQ